MSRMHRGLTIASTLLLVAVLLSACEQPYSTPPAVTNTPIDPNSFFSTPIASEQPSNMQDVENITTQTAAAASGTILPTTTATLAVVGEASATPTPIIALNPTNTATQAVVVVPTSTTVPSSGSEWILKDGEFPYCIARRYNVDPTDLINASGLTSPDIYYEGQRLIIPKNSTWPASLGARSLRSHPGTYTVTGNSDTTVYGVACKYGDVDPASIATNNNISVDATLSIGQTLSIP